MLNEGGFEKFTVILKLAHENFSIYKTGKIMWFDVLFAVGSYCE